MSKLLMPLDTSERSKRALATAERLARALQAELVLVTVLETEAEEREPVMKLLGELAGGLSCRTRVRVEYGLPTRTILAVIEEEAPELVVMSTHGGNSPDELALGSVAREILEACSVPVTLVGRDVTI